MWVPKTMALMIPKPFLMATHLHAQTKVLCGAKALQSGVWSSAAKCSCYPRPYPPASTAGSPCPAEIVLAILWTAAKPRREARFHARQCPAFAWRCLHGSMPATWGYHASVPGCRQPLRDCRAQHLLGRGLNRRQRDCRVGG